MCKPVFLTNNQYINIHLFRMVVFFFPHIWVFWGKVQQIILSLRFFKHFLVEISSNTPIPLFRQRSVHSGSASWDDQGHAFPSKLCVSLFSWQTNNTLTYISFMWWWFFPHMPVFGGKVQQIILHLCHFFFPVEISSNTPIPLFRLRSVHSGSVS